MPNGLSVNSNVENESGAIANSLPGRAMRVAMENKGMLTGKGQLYVGTGGTQDIVVTGMDGGTRTYTIPVTVAVPPPPTESASSSNPYVLVFVGNSDNEGTNGSGVKWVPFSSL